MLITKSFQLGYNLIVTGIAEFISTNFPYLLQGINDNQPCMHTFFALEDMYGLKIDEMDGKVVLRLDKSDYSTYSSMDKMLRAWLAEAKKLENGESTKEEYYNWRYKYPELDTHQIRAKVPSQEISDMLLAGLKGMEKEEKKETKRKKKK